MVIAIRLSRRARGIRPRAERGQKPELQELEDRRLMASSPAGGASSLADANQPTAVEQYMLELINRARANPAAEAQRLAALAKTDPVLRVVTAGWDINKFVQVLSAYSPRAPLAFNTRMIEAARDWNGAMLAANSQYHSPSDYLSNAANYRADDGQAYYQKASGGPNADGQNIYAYSRSVGSTDPAAIIDYFYAAFLIDWNNPDFGHLKNVMAPGPGSAGAGQLPYAEIGIGLLSGVTPTTPPPASSTLPGNGGKNVGPDLITEQFAYRPGNPILTGSFSTDRDFDGFYSIGEGLGGVTLRAVGRNGQGTFQATTWASGGYTLRLPSGTYDVTASGAGLASPVTTQVTLKADNVGWTYMVRPTLADQPMPGDYDGDGKTDLAVYRPGTGQWFLDGQSPRPFGGVGLDMPIPGDYDGDGKTDLAVYRTGSSQWFAMGAGGGRELGSFGGVGMDIPVPGDYDGIGRTEPAVYRTATAEWFVLGPNGGRLLVNFGGPGLDIPVPGDYDGDGRVEPAVYRPKTGQWFVYGKSGGYQLAGFGTPGAEIPVPGDYDGDGKTDPATYRPATAEWSIRTGGVVRTYQFGQAGVDTPLRGDFDGDGKDDLAVYRPNTGQWFARLSSTGGLLTRAYGQAGASVAVGTWISRFEEQPTSQVPLGWIIPQPTPPVPASTLPTVQTQPAVAAETIVAPTPSVNPLVSPRNALARWARRSPRRSAR